MRCFIASRCCPTVGIVRNILNSKTRLIHKRIMHYVADITVSQPKSVSELMHPCVLNLYGPGIPT